MTNGLIIYSSTDGHTKFIAEYIHNNLKDKINYKLISIQEANNLKLNYFDKIIIGASIRYGKHQKALYQFINYNINDLNRTKSSFFSVNVVARKINKNSVNTNPYLIKFLKKSNWKPNNMAVFAGKIDYQKYNFIDKHIIRFIMWLSNGPTDVSKSYEFTNWKDIDKFINVIIEQ